MGPSGPGHPWAAPSGKMKKVQLLRTWLSEVLLEDCNKQTRLSSPTLPCMIRKKTVTAMRTCAGAMCYPPRTREWSAVHGAVQQVHALVLGTRRRGTGPRPLLRVLQPLTSAGLPFPLSSPLSSSLGTVTKFSTGSRTGGQSRPAHALRGLQNLHPQGIGQPLLLWLDPSPALPVAPRPIVPFASHEDGPPWATLQ